MASYSHGEEAAELYEGIPTPMNARGIVTQGSVSQQLLGQQRAGNPMFWVIALWWAVVALWMPKSKKKRA